GGALIEGDTRLQPSTGICLRLTTTRKVLLIRGRVVRSSVSRVINGRLYYASGVRFYDEIEIAVEEEGSTRTSEAKSEAIANPSPVPAPALRTPSRDDAPSEQPSENLSEPVAATPVPDSLGDLSRIFGVNRW